VLEVVVVVVVVVVVLVVVLVVGWFEFGSGPGHAGLGKYWMIEWRMRSCATTANVEAGNRSLMVGYRYWQQNPSPSLGHGPGPGGEQALLRALTGAASAS
jgi:hypothetical protein